MFIRVAASLPASLPPSTCPQPFESDKRSRFPPLASAVLRGQDVIITLSDESTRQGTVHNVDPINFTVALLKVRPSARRWHPPPPPSPGRADTKRRRSCGGGTFWRARISRRRLTPPPTPPSPPHPQPPPPPIKGSNGASPRTPRDPLPRAARAARSLPTAAPGHPEHPRGAPRAERASSETRRIFLGSTDPDSSLPPPEIPAVPSARRRSAPCASSPGTP